MLKYSTQNIDANTKLKIMMQILFTDLNIVLHIEIVYMVNRKLCK